MSTVNSLSEVLGAVFVLVGLSTLNKKSFTAVMNDWSGSKGLTWTVGIVTFLAGAVSLSLYDVWSSNWEVIVTIVGWLLLLKGAFITLFPNTSMPFYRKFTSGALLVVAGVIAIIIGVVLLYLGLTA